MTSGRQLQKGLGNALSKLPTDGRRSHVSGPRFTLDPNKPVCSRILSVSESDVSLIPADGQGYTLTTIGYQSVFSATDSDMRESDVEAVRQTDATDRCIAAHRIGLT